MNFCDKLPMCWIKYAAWKYQLKMNDMHFISSIQIVIYFFRVSFRGESTQDGFQFIIKEHAIFFAMKEVNEMANAFISKELAGMNIGSGFFDWSIEH